MPRKKTNLSQYTKQVRQSKKLKSQETIEEREARLAIDRERHRSRRTLRAACSTAVSQSQESDEQTQTQLSATQFTFSWESETYTEHDNQLSQRSCYHNNFSVVISSAYRNQFDNSSKTRNHSPNATTLFSILNRRVSIICRYLLLDRGRLHIRQGRTYKTSLVPMSIKPRGKGSWDVRASTLARNTRNLIRGIVENLQVEPNPEKQLIALSVGDPTTFGNLNPPQQVIDAVRESIELHTSRGYGPSNGHLEARLAVAKYSAHQGDVQPEDVILCSGCSHAIELAVTAIADSGQNILVPRPGFMIYATHAEGLGIEIKYYNLLSHKNWEVDLDDLENQIDEDTAAIIVINPSNPCGSVYKKEHLQDIVSIASRNHVPIIADEIYEHITFSGHPFTAISSLSNDVPVLTCSGITKRFLVPGWRVGWIIIHDRNNILAKELRKGLVNLSQRILGANTIVQRALPAILEQTPQSFFDEVVLFIENNAKLSYEMLRRVPGLRPVMPQGAMYMMIEIKMSMFPHIQDELQFVEQLVSEQSVFCLPGQCFMYPNYMRVVLTVPEDILREACKRIAIFCRNHIQQRDKIKFIDDNIVSPTPNDGIILLDK